VRAAVLPLTGVALQKFAVNVLAIRFVAGREIFLDAYH
jgi:hypothetical protein